MKKHYIYLNLLFLISTALNATIIKVPDDKSKIQLAVNEAVNGDTVLVSPGTYFENVNFHNKNIVLTSYYLLNSDTSYIRTTIIDGSNPSNSDTASCIIIAKGQDSTTVLQGFTITGGQGTKWKDEHSSGTYCEGGGILIAFASPVIQHNLIVNNAATNDAGLQGTGGGGMRCGDGRPKILNNAIVNNTGKYGAGIVLNWCGAIIRNNIIAGNIGGQEYGGGGVWINNTNGKSNILENNTIVNNYSTTTGGGILMYSSAAKATLKNNIIYGNIALSSPQITLGSSISATYCNIDGGWTGIGNISNLPNFKDSTYNLSNSSPDIDAGDASVTFNDLSDKINTNRAQLPSLGGLRNDIGAYGGQGASVFPYFQFSRIGMVSTKISLGNKNSIGQLVKQKIKIVNQSTEVRKIDSVTIMLHKDQLNVAYLKSSGFEPAQTDSIVVQWNPVSVDAFLDTILIYHDAINTKNPIKISVSGKASNPLSIKNSSIDNVFENFPNPFSDKTNIVYSLKDQQASIVIYNILGDVIKYYDKLNGSGSVCFEGSALPNGVYIYKLITPDQNEVINKMLIQH